MPTTEDGKKTGAAARAEQAEDNSFVSKDVFENPALRTLTLTGTAVDAGGTERVVVTNSERFEPAPLEATDEQKAHMEAFNAKLESAAKERAALLSTETKDEDRVPNEPYNAGSQTGSTSDEGAGDKGKAGELGQQAPQAQQGDGKQTEQKGK